MDWTGKEILKKGKGLIPKNVDGILTRLKISNEQWLDGFVNFNDLFYLVVGAEKTKARELIQNGKKWNKGAASNQRIFGEVANT